MIEPAKTSDSVEIAILHLSSITEGFLPKLGEAFLSALYKFLIKSEIVLIYREDNKIQGFVSGSLKSDKLLRKFMLFPEGVYRLFVALLLKPSLMVSAFEVLLIPGKNKLSNNNDEGELLPESELLSIAVASETRQKGLGTKLMSALERKFKERGVAKYKVVAGSKLKAANDFYLRNGFKNLRIIKIHNDEQSVVYVKGI